MTQGESSPTPSTASSQRFAGKRVIISGAGSGIGRAAAVAFGREGAKVGLIEKDLQAAEQTESTIAADGGEALVLPVDVIIEEQVAGAVAKAIDRWAGLDIVVANAGVMLVGEDARADELDAAVWRRTIDINLTGAFFTCKHGIRGLLTSGGGSVICTASPTGLYGLAPGFAAYSSSKAGVYGLVRVMANDYARDSIRVNAVIPGTIDTPLAGHVLADDDVREQVMAQIPLGRPGTAEEVASMMLFLASDEASYVTGAGFFVDGGMTAV